MLECPDPLVGCVLLTSRAPLQASQILTNNLLVPKPQASWVYIRHFWTVPFSVLGWFNKAPGLLQVSKDCLAQMIQDIKQKYDSHLQDALDRLGVVPVVVPAPAPAPAHAPTPCAPVPVWRAAPNWRTASAELQMTTSQQATGRVMASYSKVLSGACVAAGGVNRIARVS